MPNPYLQEYDSTMTHARRQTFVDILDMMAEADGRGCPRGMAFSLGIQWGRSHPLARMRGV